MIRDFLWYLLGAFVLVVCAAIWFGLMVTGLVWTYGAYTFSDALVGISIMIGCISVLIAVLAFYYDNF